MKLSTRMALAMVALVLVTTGVLALLTYYNVISLVLPRALDRLQVHARVAAMMLDASLQGMRADALSAQASPALRSLGPTRVEGLDPDHRETGADLRARIENRFVADLAAKPEYALIRIIGAADGGMELVRVDRLGPDGAIRIVPTSGLTRRGDRAYFKEGVQLPPNYVHISKVELNKNDKGLEVPHAPTIRASAPLYGSDGKAFAVLVINFDLGPALERVRASLTGGREAFVINEAGDYLVHPADPSKEFGFDLGERHRIQDDFPDFEPMLKADRSEPRVMTRRDGARYGLGWEWVRLAGGPRVAVVEVRSYGVLTSVGQRGQQFDADRRRRRDAVRDPDGDRDGPLVEPTSGADHARGGGIRPRRTDQGEARRRHRDRGAGRRRS